MGLLELLGVSSLGDMLNDMLGEFMANMVNTLFGIIDFVLATILDNMLRVETLVSITGSPFLNESTVSNMFTFIYTFCCVLIVIKFLFKGFKIYILWRDGDADSSPQDMLIGVAQAAIVMVSFPFLYNIMADVTIYFAKSIMQAMGTYETINFTTIFTPGLGVVYLVIVLIYAIMFLILWIKLIARGFELLILRLGVPFACLGLIDSDMGMFKGYMQVFFKTLVTSVVQIALTSLSLKIITSISPTNASSILNLIFGIAILQMAFRTPALMQQFMIQGNAAGGGLTSKIYTGAMAAGGIKRLIHR